MLTYTISGNATGWKATILQNGRPLPGLTVYGRTPKAVSSDADRIIASLSGSQTTQTVATRAHNS